MATMTTTGFSIQAPINLATALPTRPNHRRSISPEAGRALELLGHAVEYLTDEFVQNGGTFNGSDSRLEAIRVLMALNRQVYYECPEVPTLAERWRAFLNPHLA